MKKETQNAHLFNFEDLSLEAENYLEAVRQKAREILTDAAESAQKQRADLEMEAARIRENARSEGFQEGLKQGAAEAEQNIQAEVVARVQREVEMAVHSSEQGFCRLLDQCVTLREEMSQTWEQAFLHLVCRVCRVILRRELQTEPQITIQRVREMLELASGENSLILSLNPEDATLLKSPLERLCGEFRQLGKIEIQTSPNLERGDCVLKSENGLLDQRLDVQLARIEEELLA